MSRSIPSLVVFCVLFIAPFAFGASPGLPFTEDFSDQTLMDGALTSADWSTEEQAAYLKFASQFKASPGTYGNPVNFGTGSDNTYCVAFGDVDGDGDLDLAIANYNQQNAVYLYNSATGTYGNPVNFGTGSDNTRSVAFGDVDGDGDLDLATGNFTQQNVVYFYNRAAGTYGNPVNFGTGSDATRSVAFGDVDGDGDLDLATGNSGGQQNAVYLYNSAAGTYGNPVNFGTGSDSTHSIVFGDVDGDGDLDLATGNDGGQNAVYLYNHATGAYSDSVNFGTGSDGTVSVAFGDVDGDGDLDLATGNFGGQNTVYLYNKAAGTYGNPVNFGTGTDSTNSVAFGDVDGDGDLDLATGNHAEQNVVYLYDNATGTYGNPVNFGTGSVFTLSVVFGDVDGDGDLDLATGNNEGQNAVYLRGGHVVNSRQVVSHKVNSTETNIARVTLTAVDNTNSSTTRNADIRYYISNNGGAKWYRVKSGTPFNFTTFGNDIRWKAEMTSLSPAISPKLTSVSVVENLVSYNNTTATTLRNSFAALDIDSNGILSQSEGGFATLADVKAYDADGDGVVDLSDLLSTTVGPVGVASPVYVNFSNAGTENGAAPATGFNTVLEAAVFVADGGTISISSGSSTETIYIEKSMTMVSTGGSATVGATP